jgi:hypothetical protein
LNGFTERRESSSSEQNQMTLTTKRPKREINDTEVRQKQLATLQV